MSIKQGQIEEEKACAYLSKQGLVLLEKNFRTKCGELDLIMRDKSEIVFVEVRMRKSNAYGGAVASVTYAKQQKLIKTAALFLLKKGWHDKYPYRFDILAIEGLDPEFIWLKNAIIMG